MMLIFELNIFYLLKILANGIGTSYRSNYLKPATYSLQQIIYVTATKQLINLHKDV